MTSLFGGRDTPSVPAPVAPPTTDQGQVAADYNDKLRKRKGRASTILSPDVSETSAPVAQKSLLGT